MESKANRAEEHWSLISLAFGAVTGTILSILLQPIVDLLPAKLFEEFLNQLVEKIISFGLPVLCAYIATRIGRLDLFLKKYLATAAFAISLMLAASMWVHAGSPYSGNAAIAVAATIFESWFFLLFCGGAVQTGLSQIVGKQEAEYTERREADAQDIAAKAIAEGDPDIAVGIFSAKASGDFGQAMSSGCLLAVLGAFQVVAIFIVSALDAHVLFHLSWAWSACAAAIIDAAAIGVVTMSEAFGEQHAETVPLEEKYRGILPNPDDRD